MRRPSRMLAAVLLFAACFAAHGRELPAEQRALHVLNRLGYGPRPGDIEQVSALGVERYIASQLNPETIALPAALSERLTQLPAVQMSASESLAEFIAVRQTAKEDKADGKQQQRDTVRRLTEQVGEARLARAIESPRQLEEVMVDFWFNHFNVFAGKGDDRALVASYERDAIRPHVLGRFRDLLGATATHPAMLFYLDNWLSAAPGFQPRRRVANDAAAPPAGLNENYARELMELHTLGVDGGYTQKDVTELARIFTGWTFAPREMATKGTGFRFDARRHDWGAKEWLGYRVAANGRGEGEWALDVLAAHPATARHISYALAQYFVADVPPPALVDRLARRFLDTQGDIRAVLATLFASPEFWDPAHVGNKFKTPYQYVVSGMRAAGASVSNVRPLLGALSQLGMPLYGCQTPDGYKNTEDAWLNPEALTRRINFAGALASGKLQLVRPTDADRVQDMRQRESATPVDAERLMTTLGNTMSPKTRETITNNPPALRAALLLGSPDFIRH